VGYKNTLLHPLTLFAKLHKGNESSWNWSNGFQKIAGIWHRVDADGA